MARMDWTRTFVEASGLRPTASEAFMPIRPTPMAAPSAARPTCRLPLISARGSDILVLFYYLFTGPGDQTRANRRRTSFVHGRGLLFLLLTHQQREDSRQQHENHRLDETHDELQEIKWNREQPAQARDESGHRFQHGFPSKIIAVQTKTEGNRAKQNGDYLYAAYREEN